LVSVPRSASASTGRVGRLELLDIGAELQLIGDRCLSLLQSFFLAVAVRLILQLLHVVLLLLVLFDDLESLLFYELEALPLFFRQELELELVGLMLQDALPQQEDHEVVTYEHVVLLIHVDVSQSHDQVMESLGWLETQQLLLDGRVGLLNHPELLISRVFQYAKTKRQKSLRGNYWLS